MVQDPEVARIYWDGIADRDSLSESDRRRFDPLLSIMVQGIAQQHQFQLDGIASPRAWEMTELALPWVFAQPGVRHWWREWSGGFPQDFRD